MAPGTSATPRAWALGDAATVRGFRLAGVQGRAVASVDEARRALEEARRQGVTLVVLTEDLADALGDDFLDAQLLPLVAVVPRAGGARPEHLPGQRLSRIVHRALGMPAEPQG